MEGNQRLDMLKRMVSTPSRQSRLLLRTLRKQDTAPTQEGADEPRNMLALVRLSSRRLGT